MSNKLVILRRLTKILEGITTYVWTDEEGVEHVETYDFAGKVFRGRRAVSAQDALGCLSILEAPRPAIGQGAGQNQQQARQYDWTLNIQGWPEEDRLNPSDPCYTMAAAVRERLSRVTAVNSASGDGEPGAPVYPEDYMLGGLIVGLTLADSLVLPAQENLSRVAFWYNPIVISFVGGRNGI